MSEQTVCEHLHVTSMQRTGCDPVHICADCGSTLSAQQARAEFIPTSNVSDTLGMQICAVLRLDPKRITSLRLVMDSGYAPVLEISRVILGDDIPALRKVIEQYQISPSGSASQAVDPDSTRTN